MIESTSSALGSEGRIGRQEDRVTEAALRMKEDIQRIVDGFDIQAMGKKIEEFGRQNPVGLALTALTLGVAAGILMRGSKGASIS